MKVHQLRQIIKEEIARVLNEDQDPFDKWNNETHEEREAMKQEFLGTPRGRNAVTKLRDLISKPYRHGELDDVLQILNLNKDQFMYAAEEAGMKYGADGRGIHIFDKNYKNEGVSIDYINGEWIVG